VVLREGDLTQDLAVIGSGRVALRLRVPERGPTTILTLEAGDVIGWSALLPPHRATSTVIALEASELILMDGEDLRAELAADPELAAAVYSALLEALARRLVATRQQLLDLFAQPVCEPW
jgi:CRP-like cAMP-binding protein